MMKISGSESESRDGNETSDEEDATPKLKVKFACYKH